MRAQPDPYIRRTLLQGALLIFEKNKGCTLWSEKYGN